MIDALRHGNRAPPERLPACGRRSRILLALLRAVLLAGLSWHACAAERAPLTVEDLVARLGIDSFSRTGVRRLSGGQKQRLALAAALVAAVTL